MPNENNFNIEAANLQTHLNIIQGIINRMGANSANCKTLCVTLVAAISAVATSAKTVEVLWVSIFPIVIFCLLDMFYFSLEKGFRNEYTEFVKKIHKNEVKLDELFIVKAPPTYKSFTCSMQAFKSWSIWVVYPGMLVLVLIIYLLIH